MTIYLSNRDGNGKTSEEGHYKFPTSVFSGNVLGSTDLQVTQNSPAAMNVLVLPGQFKIDTGTNYSYTGWSTSNVTIAISTADPANPRISTVVAYVDKNASTSASPPNNPGIVKLMSVDGTPAASPSAPNSTVIQTAVGSGNPYIALADVRVAAAASTVVTANITDRRTLIQVLAGLVKNTSIQDSSVTTTKIADSNVTTAKIADSNITTAKIGANQVTAAKIEVQQGWQSPTMQNGWNRYDTTYEDIGYYKDSLGVVRLKGLAKGGTSGLMFTLPTGYRPLFRKIFTQQSNAALARVDVSADGTVIATTYNNAWLSLEGISFRAEQ